MTCLDEQLGFFNSSQVMETEYFETSWKSKIQVFRRRVIGLFREATKKYRKKKKTYTRFLTDDEKRLINNFPNFFFIF